MKKKMKKEIQQEMRDRWEKESDQIKLFEDLKDDVMKEPTGFFYSAERFKDNPVTNTISDEVSVYYRAGFAVVTLAMEGTFDFIDIDNEEIGSLSFVADDFKPTKSDAPVEKPKDFCEKSTIAILAGPVAAHIIGGEMFQVYKSESYNSALNIAYQFCGSLLEMIAFTDWLWIKTENMITLPVMWHAVERLAKELLDCRRIEYTKVKKIVEDSFTSYSHEKNGVKPG